MLNRATSLAGQNIDEQRPMASTLKTLTALTLLPRLRWRAPYEAIAGEITEGIRRRARRQHHSVSQLFHGMMMRSGNDAAVALDAYGYQRTLDAMNAEAQRIGATSTVAKSPNWPRQARAGEHCRGHGSDLPRSDPGPACGPIATAREFEFRRSRLKDPTKAQNTFTIFNHDSILNSDYPALGGKSGFTAWRGPDLRRRR